MGRHFGETFCLHFLDRIVTEENNKLEADSEQGFISTASQTRRFHFT